MNMNSYNCSRVTFWFGIGLLSLSCAMIKYSFQETEFERMLTASLVLMGVGISMLLFSLLFSLMTKCRTMRQTNSSANVEDGQQGESQPDEPKQYTVPSYEEVVGNAQYPISQFSPRQNSTTKLPTYDEVMETMQYEVEGSGPPAHMNGADNLNLTHVHTPPPQCEENLPELHPAAQ